MLNSNSLCVDVYDAYDLHMQMLGILQYRNNYMW